jgi:hypothetical protein
MKVRIGCNFPFSRSPCCNLYYTADEVKFQDPFGIDSCKKTSLKHNYFELKHLTDHIKSTINHEKSVNMKPLSRQSTTRKVKHESFTEPPKARMKMSCCIILRLHSYSICPAGLSTAERTTDRSSVLPSKSLLIIRLEDVMVRKPWYVKKPVVFFHTSKKPPDRI